MAICRWCNQEMRDSVSCIGKTEDLPGNTVVEFPDGSTLPSIPYHGDEPCHDCKTPSGGYHHPGCDSEKCPKCGGQLISCGCLDEE